MEGSSESPLTPGGSRSLPAAGAVFLGPASAREPTVRGILRVVVTVVVSAIALYLVYQLRTPIGWLLLATFIAVSVSAPVNVLSSRMPRGLAIAIVYLGLILIPIMIGAILVPPAVRAASDLVSNFPGYVSDLKDTVQQNETLNNLNQDYDLVGRLQQVANDAAGSLDDVAATLASLGAGLVGSLFALFTILVMSMFMVARGRAWTQALLATRRPHQADAIGRTLDRIASAVSSYVGGALAQATIAGITAFVVLSILGIPSPLALAVVIALLDLIPLVGASVGAVLVGIVTFFTDFPTATIVWAIYALAYQQFENYVVQPRIQSRAVALDPFLIVVAAIFGGTLLGVIGALLAIPAAAALQIAVREFLAFRRTYAEGEPAQEEIAAESGPAPGG